jgi:polysaccharide biosynthesis protein PslG
MSDAHPKTHASSRVDRSVADQLVRLGHQPIARIQPRSAREIGRSPWSIGCETLDRDFADFTHTGPHLGDLGATQARLQAGWAKTDSGDGRYDFAWLDAIVDGCLGQGVRPWLELAYGNPAYPGGGGVGLSEGWPRSPVALDAWDRWVTTTVERYRDRVTTWEIWNEPENHAASTAEQYAAFFIRTARLVRACDPDARIVGLALGGAVSYAGAVLAALDAAEAGSLLDELSFHFYPHNPDGDFDKVAELAALLARHTPHASLRQGETGCPSETVRFMALGEYTWSERKQAAWDLRRLLAHHARGIPMNLFQLSDMHYGAGRGLYTGRNSKGLLCTTADHRVAYRKPSYAAAQHVFSVFDDRFPLRAMPNLAGDEAASTAAHAWTRDGDEALSLVAWWRCDQPPALEAPEIDTVTLPPQPIGRPVLVDFLSGVVFAPHEGGGDALWRGLPRTDVPLGIAEHAVLPLGGLEGA